MNDGLTNELTIAFSPNMKMPGSEKVFQSILTSKGAFGQKQACRMRLDTIFWMYSILCVAHNTNKTQRGRHSSDFFQKP